MLTFTLVGVDIHFVVYIYNYWCKFTPNCVELHRQVSRCSTWATVNLGTQELGLPGNLGQMIFRGPIVQCCFFTGLQTPSSVLGFYLNWSPQIADGDKDFGGLLGHLFINCHFSESNAQ